MKDMERDRHDRVVSEIRGALDREVARRFDSERFAADHAGMIERLELERRMARLRSRRTPRPFARVPVPLQWLGLAASIVAAAAGIRSVYRGWNPPTPVERVASAPVASEAAPPSSSLDVLPEPQALPSLPPPAAASARKREKAPERAPSLEKASPVDKPPETQPQSPTAGPPASPPAAPVSDMAKQRVLPKREPTIVAAESAGAAATPHPSPQGGAPSVTGVPSSSAVPVRVVSQRLFKQGLIADVREIPQMQATLISIGGRRSPYEADGDSTRSDPETSALQTGRPLPAIPENPEGPGGETPAIVSDEDAGAEVSTVRGGVSGRGESAGTYYVRTFIGSRERSADGRGGYLAKTVKAVTLPDREAWGTLKQQLTLQAIFGMRFTAIDGAFLPIASGEGGGAGSVVVAAAEKVYEIGIKGERAGEGPEEHTVSLRVARMLSGPTSEKNTPGIEIPIQIRNGAVALVCLADPILSRQRESGEGGVPPGVRILCVAVSPRFADLRRAAELGPFTTSERGHELPVVIERPEPIYPDQARELAVKGEVMLDLTVLKDGEVYGVHVVSLPAIRGAELLIEPATNAVRRYRFLPARIHGEKVDAVVRTKVRFGME